MSPNNEYANFHMQTLSSNVAEKTGIDLGFILWTKILF